MTRLWVGLGALAGLLAVALAAFAAHGEVVIGPARVQMLRNGNEILGWHALALLFCGLWVTRAGLLAELAAAFFAVGLLFFCGAVDSLALANLSLGIVAPTGGIILMLGWLLLLASVLRAR